MGMKKFGAVAVCLAFSTPSFAEAPAKEKEVWITIGTDALEPARAAFKAQGLQLPAPAREKAGVAALRVRESHLEKLAEAMHDKLNRCAGFISHDTEEQALKAVEGPQSIGATAILNYTINNGASVNAMLAGVQELNIRNTINSLSTNWTTRRYNVQSGIDAANWLKTQWTNIANGRTDVSVALFTHASTTSPQPSVIATITGSTHPNEVVVIGGHLDSINGSSSTAAAPGADDDASGVASLTEVFRVAIANGYKPARTVKFMAYAAEEIGLKGSADIANNHAANGVNVVGVLQLDMTNYKGSSYDFGMVTDNTNATLNTHTTNLISTYLPGLTWTNITCGYGCSDHASWNAKGYPATMPFEATMSTDNPQIHTTGDTLTFTGGTATNSVKFAKLGVAFMGEVAKGATTGNTPPPVNDGTTTPPPGNTLTNGVATAAYSGSSGTWKCWTLSVPTGKTSVVFNQVGLSGTTGDADLYVRYNAAPTSSSYNCRPYLSGSTETCTINSPTAGTWHACSYGYSAYSNVTMKGTY